MPVWCGKKVVNISPPLNWSDVPDGTRSFALVIVDVHPVAHGNLHWMISDLPADTRSFHKGAVTQLPTGTREYKAYVGPFPPSGTHSYEFGLFALGTPKLALPVKVAFDVFAEAVETNALGKAVLVGTFTKV